MNENAPLWHRMNMNGISQTEIAEKFEVSNTHVCLVLKKYRFQNNLAGPSKGQYSRHMDRPETTQDSQEWRARAKKKWDEGLQMWITECPKAYAWGYGLDQKVKPRPHKKTFKDYSSVNL